MRLHCGCVAVPVSCFFDIISSFLAKFKNVVHSLEPGETPSVLCATLLNIAKYFKTLRCGCGAVAFIFSIYLKPILYHVTMKRQFQVRIQESAYEKA